MVSAMLVMPPRMPDTFMGMQTCGVDAKVPGGGPYELEPGPVSNVGSGSGKKSLPGGRGVSPRSAGTIGGVTATVGCKIGGGRAPSTTSGIIGLMTACACFSKRSRPLSTFAGIAIPERMASSISSFSLVGIVVSCETRGLTAGIVTAGRRGDWSRALNDPLAALDAWKKLCTNCPMFWSYTLKVPSPVYLPPMLVIPPVPPPKLWKPDPTLRDPWRRYEAPECHKPGLKATPSRH